MNALRQKQANRSCLASLLFLLLVMGTACAPAPASSTRPQDLEAIASAALVNANAENGLAILEKYSCTACHLSATETRLAPSFAGLWQVAGERRPNLSAAAYIYESIAYPQAHLVDGYFGSMPSYRTRINESEMGDLIAFLLSPVVDDIYGG